MNPRNPRNVVHGTFAIERRYRVSPARVFAAWSDPEVKVKWFACHGEWEPRAYALDFRIGGHEHCETGPAGGTVHAFDASYRDIAADERIVYSYDMR
ncbi:MAG TPA: SRPBCC domain-containing protein, partial [Polyangiales bacterium]|nr:SRPBCC domain-containing protein [Polyangiales bacterium]